VAHKAFDFTKDKYLLNVTSDVTLDGKGLPHRLDWRGGFGDSTVPGAASKMRALYFDNAADKLISNEAKAAASGPVQARGDFAFAGMEDTYFAAVFLPPPSGQLEVQTWSDQVKLSADAKPEAHVGVAVGGEGENRLTLFAGPKNLDILESVSPKLTQIVDYGWFSILARPLFISLKWLDDTLIHNWGWSIIVITIVINSLMLPLKFSSMRSMKKMQDLAPLVKAINDKYKGIGMRDPKKAQQNEEMMALYKKNGVNPMGGCLPMALQMPFFFAFYKMLAVAIELRGANWLWVTDLSQPEHLAIHVLPITMVVTQVLMGKISPTSPAADASQQRMMTLLMPVMLGIFLYNAQSGLVLYWLTSNVVAILQQVLFNRLIPKQSPIVPEVSAPAKKRKVRT
jgi:YidC/Oxa1 family membrane protein insertase